MADPQSIRSARYRKRHPERVRARMQAWHDAHRKPRIERVRRDEATGAIREKQCSRCKQWLALSAFNRRTDRPDGLQCCCRECGRAAHAAHNKKWARKNPEKNRAKTKAWRVLKPDVARASRQRDYRQNADRYKARTKAWRESNPERHRLNNLRRETRKASLPFHWTVALARKALAHFDNACAVCRTPFGLLARLQWDHWIPLSCDDCPGTVPGNCLPLCSKCNVEKSDRDAAEWLASKFTNSGEAEQILSRITRYLAQFQENESMSYASKKNRPDSKDTARLRSEYEKKAAEFRDTKDAASKAKLRDEKQKAFGRVVENMNHERAEDLAATHKVLIGMGKLKTDAQMQQEKAKVEGRQVAAVKAEENVGPGKP